MTAADEREVRDLIAVALAKLQAMGAMLDEQVVADAFFGFHAQQVAEKLLKAWIAVLGGVYPLTHSLARLEAVLVDAGEDTSTFAELCDLTPYAVEARYSAVG